MRILHIFHTFSAVASIIVNNFLHFSPSLLLSPTTQIYMVFLKVAGENIRKGAKIMVQTKSFRIIVQTVISLPSKKSGKLCIVHILAAN
jgi:hypothetical protein